MFLVSRANLWAIFYGFFYKNIFFFARVKPRPSPLVLVGDRFHFSNCESTKTLRYYQSPRGLPWNSGMFCAGQSAQSGFSDKPERVWLAGTTTLAIERYFLRLRKIPPEFYERTCVYGSILEPFNNCCFSLEIRLFVESKRGIGSPGARIIVFRD